MLKERNKPQQKSPKQNNKLKDKQTKANAHPTLLPQHTHMQIPHLSPRQMAWASAVSLMLSLPLTPDCCFPHSGTGAVCWGFYMSSELISLSPRCLKDKQTNMCHSQDSWFLGIQSDLIGRDGSMYPLSFGPPISLPPSFTGYHAFCAPK